jgi:hypothetical protein
MKWTVFDLEFNQLLPSIEEPWSNDLHITCASIFSDGDEWPQVWYERNEFNETPGDYMSEQTITAFVLTLSQLVQRGYSLVTWGGASSDWRMLHKECPSLRSLIVQLALNSVDVPMCACMSIGTMMGLNAACKALGYTLKDDASSSNVPDKWLAPEERQQVLQHVSSDAYATMFVLRQAVSTGQLPWITQRGQLKTWHNVSLQSVRACLSRELPNVPWTIQPNQNPKILARWLFFEI